jgi:thioredoxin
VGRIEYSLKEKAMRRSVLLSLILLISVLFVQAAPGSEDEGKVMKIDKSEFQKKIMNYEKNSSVWKYEGSKPCVVDFYADWCAPCRKAAPVMEELAEKYKGKVLFYKINTDQEKEIASLFQITGIPAFLWVPMSGKPVMKTGVAGDAAAIKEQFEKAINEILLKK